MTDDRTPRSRSGGEQFQLAYAARLMLITAALFVVAGVIWLVDGSNALIGVGFVAVGLGTATFARMLLGRIAQRRQES